MKHAMRLLPFMVVLGLVACTASAPVTESAPSQAVQASTPAKASQLPRGRQLAKGESPPANIEADFCFTVYGSCGFAYCDGDWNDTQSQSKVCCYNGSCISEGYWTCGGPCMPETTSCN